MSHSATARELPPDVQSSSDPLIGTLGGAEALMRDVTDAVAALARLIEEETRLVRLGALFAAADLQAEKSRLSANYVKLRFKVRDNAVAIGHLPADLIRELTERHEIFAEQLKINMAVLATARELAEDIVRNVANAVGRSNAPTTYGPESTMSSPTRHSARGIAVNKAL